MFHKFRTGPMTADGIKRGASALLLRVPKIELNDMKWQVDDTKVTKNLF